MIRFFVAVGVLMNSLMSVDAQLINKFQSTVDPQIIQLSDSEYYQLDSIYTYSSVNNSWSMDLKVSNTFDSYGNIQNSISQKDEGGNWENLSQLKYEYTTDNSGWSKVNNIWDNSQNTWKSTWKKAYRQISGNEEVEINYSEQSQTGQWANIWQQNQQYNQLGDLVAYTTIKYNESTDVWDEYWEYQCVYDSNRKLIQTTHKSYDTSNKNWDDEMEIIVDYNAENPVGELIIDWDAETSSWINLRKTSISYPQSNNVTRQFENWDKQEEAWKTNTRVTETKDNNGNIVEVLKDTWDSQTETWVHMGREIYSYNIDDIRLSEEKYTWNKLSANWDNFSKKEYYYSKNEVPSTSLPDNNLTNFSLEVYPNPAVNNLYVKFEGTAKILRIYGANGEVLISEKWPVSGNAFDVSSLMRGVYIVELEMEGGRSVSKFVKK